jgi:regulator of replication initiation timing
MSEHDLPVRDEIARIDGNIEGIITRLGNQGETIAQVDMLIEEMQTLQTELEHIEVRLNTLESRIG